MRIGIDARVLEKKITGIGRILMGVIQNLSIIEPGIEFVLFTNKHVEFVATNCTIISTNTSRIFSKIVAPFWLDYILPKYLVEHGIDLFFAPNYFLPKDLRKNNIKSVVVIHDVIHKVYPEFQPLFYRNYLDIFVRRSVENADLIITDSECSKKDIEEYYKIQKLKLKVIYPFSSERFMFRPITEDNCKKIKIKYALPDKFILFVGVIEKRKNIESIIKISAELQNKNIFLPIILIGRKGYGGKRILNLLRPTLNIKYLDYVDDIDLPYIYNLSNIFLFPSFYEGFGFPPLEAMQSGVPVIVSNAGSLPEVVGNSIPTFDSRDIKGFVDQIEKILSDQNYYNKLQKESLNQAKKFAKESSLNEILQVFKNVSPYKL